MPGTISIELRGVRFFAFHGLYPGEKKTGQPFETDLTVSYIPPSGIIAGLEDTVNYAALYALLEAEMQKPRELLETFVMEMAVIIHQAFPQVKNVDIVVRKLAPPIERFSGTAAVRYSTGF